MVYKTLSTDFYYENSGVTSLSYYITADSGTIYTGRAFNPKGIKINVRKAIDDWLVNDMPDFREYDGVMVEHEDAFKVFGLHDIDGTLLEEYGVFLTYEDNWLSEVTYRGIDGKADPRQKIFVGVLSDSPVDVVLDTTEVYQIIFERPFVFDWDSGVTTICYTANTDFTLSSYTGGWFTVEQTKADEFTGCLTFTYTENEGNSERGGTLCMDYENSYGATDTRCFPVTQKEYSDVGPGDPNEYLTFNVISGGTISWVWYQSWGDMDDKHGKYSISASTDNGETWRTLEAPYWVLDTDSGNTIEVSAGDKVMFKGNNQHYFNIDGYMSFSGTSVVDVEGNIMSLIYGDNFASNGTLPDANTFRYLFGGDSGSQSKYIVRSAEKLVLPSTALTENCYYGMFSNCRSLEIPPYLPSRNLASACYSVMFAECYSLKKAPKLKATTLAERCYYGMFEDCYSLTAAPNLPATELVETAGDMSGFGVYFAMFRRCTALVKAPVISATITKKACFRSMFEGCTSLVKAPDLLMETLADAACTRMFYGCTSLQEIKCMATNSGSYTTPGWVTNVPTGGTFTKKNGTTWSTGQNGIPSGWTVQDAV